jgi:hypothetical protein
VVHTHPNGFSSEPSGIDLDIADKHRVPVFTITSRGMFVYDPANKKTWKVLDGLAWLERPNGSRSLPAWSKSERNAPPQIAPKLVPLQWMTLSQL